MRSVSACTVSYNALRHNFCKILYNLSNSLNMGVANALPHTPCVLLVCCNSYSHLLDKSIVSSTYSVIPLLNVSTCTAGDPPIQLGRTPQDQCSGTQLVCRGCQPFVNERITARVNATFLAQIGPSGNERGYMSITGIDFIHIHCEMGE